jgi:hypothetical protein
MTTIPRISPEDTLQLLQLAHESAVARGRKAQAEQLSPLMSEMRTLVTQAQNSQPAAVRPGEITGQSDFRKLLELTQTRASGPTSSNPVGDALERNRLVAAMAAGSMSEIEIARQMGMTRDEVRMVLSASQKRVWTTEGAR